MTMATDNTTVRITRTFDAPVDRVYRAWLDPEVLSRWLAPGERYVTSAEVDEQPGGRFSVWQSDADGSPIGGMEADITELAPNERIVFDWRFVGPEREAGPTYPTRLTIELRNVEGGTELTLVHERLDSLRAALPDVADSVETGWQLVFDKLDIAV